MKTFQKANNPYLYPPHSTHTPGMINGIISVYSRRITNRTWNTPTFWSSWTFSSIKRLIKQGWDQAVLKDVFESALTKLCKTGHNPIPIANGPALPANPQECLFFHMEFHPRDIIASKWEGYTSKPVGTFLGLRSAPSKNNWERRSKSQTVQNGRQRSE